MTVLITIKIVTDMIEISFRQHHDQVSKLAKLVEEHHLHPFCDTHGLQFVEGRGSWTFKDYTHAPDHAAYRDNEEDWVKLAGYDELLVFMNLTVPGVGVLWELFHTYPDFEAQERKTKNLAERLDEFCEPITCKDLYSQQEIAAAFEVLAQQWRAVADKPIVEGTIESNAEEGETIK